MITTANRTTTWILPVNTPQFFCVGAQKCGTTALHHYLTRHPKIFLPSIKETHFFDDGHNEWSLGIEHYLSKYFAAAPAGTLAGEIDPEYLFFPEVPARLSRHFPAARLIFLFREPVSRAYSHYWMTRRRGRESLDFAAALDAETGRLRGAHLARSDYSYASRGFYAAQVERYLKYFPRDHMLFLLSDDLKRKPQETLEKIYAFLGIDPVPYAPVSDEESHQAYMPRSMSFQTLLEGRSRMKQVGKAILPDVVRRPMMNMLYRIQAHNRKSFIVPPLDTSVHERLRVRFVNDVQCLMKITGCKLAQWLPKNHK